MKQSIKLRVNGEDHFVNVHPETPLLHVLRNDLKLKSAKFACGLEQCGACKVIIDGQAVPSCRLSARSAQSREITTLEGLGTRDNLHPLQQAFIDVQAIQCGYCVPGMIISAKVLLDRNPNPTDAEIKAEMSDHLCRCGVYDRIRRAIRQAAGNSEDKTSWSVSTASVDKPSDTNSEPISTDSMAGTLPYRSELDAWVRIDAQETITIFTGKVELGQHIKTALSQIAAEELMVDINRIRLISGDTDQTPNEGYTAGSMSMEFSGNAIRNASAEVRQILLQKAAEKLGVSLDKLTVDNGIISESETGDNIDYWELYGGQRFDDRVTEIGTLVAESDYKIVGQPLFSNDLVAKVVGEPCFVQDLELPEMVHGQVVRPPTYGAKLISVDDAPVIKLPGVIKIVRDGSYLAVVAEREEEAIQAVKQLKKSATWEIKSELPPQGSLFEAMKAQPHQAYLVVDGMTVKEKPSAIQIPDSAAKTLSASYYRPYQMHASLGPSASVAQLIDDNLTVWSHNQGPFLLRYAIAQVLGMDRKNVRVIHMDGPGCYGHNGADDAGMDAALLARAVPGRPVSLKWMRDEELAWEPYGPSMIMDTQASLDEEGKIIQWNYDVWSSEASGRPRPDAEGGSGLLSSWYLEKPFNKLSSAKGDAPQLGSSRNADPLYELPRKRIVNHLLPESPLRVSSHRGLGSYANIFAIESFMDELAHAAGIDPVEFRLQHLTDERASAVIEAAAEKAEWQKNKNNRQENWGQGMGFLKYKNSASYVALVVNLKVDPASGQIVLLKAVVAADAGQIVNPDGIANQLEGAFLQAASWTLKEQVRFDQLGITSLDWLSYPIVRFRESPEVTIELIDQPGKPYLGVGEGAMGPAPAAIANAVFDAVGVRLRQIPFTPEKIKQAIEA